jgi:hypothetical protein
MAQTENQLRRMAEESFGYGSWDGDFWFIGPEQGDEEDSTLAKRVEAWRKLEKYGLCDCHRFHKQIGESRWHGLNGKPPLLQSTWKMLIRLLLSYKTGEDPDLEQVRDYQANKWGRRGGETCVIELSGIPAHDLAAGATINSKLFSPEQLHDILKQRIDVICRRLKERPPQLLVMYGKGSEEHWRRIEAYMSRNIRASKLPRTAVLNHPTTPGTTNEFWSNQGKELRSMKRKQTWWPF